VTRAVLLDAGHTLVHPVPDLGTIYAEVTATFGCRLDPRDFAAVLGPLFKDAARDYQSQTRASDAQDRAMWQAVTRRLHAAMPGLGGVPFEAWFAALYDRFGSPETWRCYDDVVPVLAELRSRGLRLGIVSNWDTRLRRIAEGIGLASQVDFMVISAEAGVRKPDPGIFGVALRRAGVRPEEALHVGDLPEEDVEGARRAGVRPVLIERRGRAGRVSPVDGVPLVSTLEAVLALL
jgi:putative hydrolase of the HAD superfamily